MASRRGLAEREYPGQRLDDLARLAAGAEDPVAVSELGQRTAEILQPLRGQGEKVGAIVAEAMGGCCTRRIVRQPALAGLQEFLLDQL